MFQKDTRYACSLLLVTLRHIDKALERWEGHPWARNGCDFRRKCGSVATIHISRVRRDTVTNRTYLKNDMR